MAYALVAIVKDEAANISRLVESARAAGVESFTIVDTGSSDGTQDLLRALGITVHEREWVDFGHNRSEAFALARGTATWILALDADMTVEVDPDFEPDPAVEAYMVRMGGADFEYRLPLLIRGDLPWESRGACHEYTTLPDRAYIGVPTDRVRVTTHGDRSSPEKSRWHAQTLEAELAREPDNPRTVFYLANTYWDLHDPRALALYERRAKMGGYAEEAFYSAYRYGLLVPTWPAQVQALIAAWEMRPHRLEPVYELAKGFNYRGQHHAALGFARTPVVPTQDGLFVHTSVWRWGMDFERSIAEWHAGDRAESRRIGESLLTRDIPPNIREAVERNLTFC